MQVIIHNDSGFCHGVSVAVKMAEKELEIQGQLYCLGDIVHNEEELQRLKKKGLLVISKESFFELKNTSVLIRAHGEPPEVFEYARKNGIRLIDATCSIVSAIQKKIHRIHLSGKSQIVIFGKKDHPEIIGFNGYCDNSARVIDSKNDVFSIDFSKPVSLFSQTTQNPENFAVFQNVITEKLKEEGKDINEYLTVNQTVCHHVINRSKSLKKFAKAYDVILFVSGKNSSNGKFLFEQCKGQNSMSYFISSEEELQKEWFTNVSSVGICGATSTPFWLMVKIAELVRNLDL